MYVARYMQLTDVLSYRQTWNPETVYIFISAIYLNVGSYYRVIDWVREQQQFCLTQERICYPKPQAGGTKSVRGSNKLKLLFSEKPVYNCFVIHFRFFLNFFVHLSIRCFQYPHPSSPRIWTTPLDIVTSISLDLLNQWKQDRPSINSSIAGDRSINCWQVNRKVLH